MGGCKVNLLGEADTPTFVALENRIGPEDRTGVLGAAVSVGGVNTEKESIGPEEEV